MDLDVLVLRGLTLEEKDHFFTVGRNKNRKTKKIFVDYCDDKETNTTAIYTTYNCLPLHYKISDNGVVRYDLKQLYLACEDITEQEFVDKFLYDMRQWEKITRGLLFKDLVAEWRKEQRHKVKSQMFGVLLNDALDPGSKTKTSSAKYLLEKYYDPTTKSGKQSVKEKKEENSLILETLKEDADRLKDFKLN